MDLIANGTGKQRNIELVDPERLLQEKRAELAQLQSQLDKYRKMVSDSEWITINYEWLVYDMVWYGVL